MNLIFYVILFQIFFFSGCASLKTPRYIGPNKVQTESHIAPTRYFNSNQKLTLYWPVPKPIRLNQKFKSGPKRIRHQGIDLGGNKGSPILSAHDGYVLYAGHDFNGFGRMIILENSEGYATFYAHLQSIGVSEGQLITAGERIGTMGRTGRATGVHLHFELRINKKAVDPLPYLPELRYPADLKN